MKSVQTVLSAIGAPIDFETILFSEVQDGSAKSEDVIKSINRNKICLMVIIPYWRIAIINHKLIFKRFEFNTNNCTHYNMV